MQRLDDALNVSLIRASEMSKNETYFKFWSIRVPEKVQTHEREWIQGVDAAVTIDNLGRISKLESSRNTCTNQPQKSSTLQARIVEAAEKHQVLWFMQPSTDVSRLDFRQTFDVRVECADLI